MALPMLRRVWDPFAEMRQMQQEMDSLFERLTGSGESRGLSAVRAPLTELEDRGDSFVFSAELPGLEKEDIKIEVDPRSITVRGERKEKKEESKKKEVRVK